MKALADLAAQSKVNLVGMVTWAFEFEDKGIRGLPHAGDQCVDKPVLSIFRMAGCSRRSRGDDQLGGDSAEEIVRAGVRGSGRGCVCDEIGARGRGDDLELPR